MTRSHEWARNFALAATVLALGVPWTAWGQDSTSTDSDAQAPAQLLAVAPRGGFGRFVETTVDQQAELFSFGVAARWQPDVRSRVSGELMAASYPRDYLQQGVGASGSRPTITTDEWRIEGNANYAYNLLYQSPVDLFGYLGWRHSHFTNDGFDHDLSGVLVGGELVLPVNDDFAFTTSLDHTFNLLAVSDEPTDPGLSVTGRPKGSLRFSGGVDIAPSNGTEISVFYLGEHLPYEHSDLFLHQVMLEVGFVLRL